MAFSGASVKLNSNYTSSGVPEEEIPWEAENFDEGGWWDAGTPIRLTVPSGISYAKSAGTIRFTDSGTGLNLYSRLYHRNSGGTVVNGLFSSMSCRIRTGTIRGFSICSPWVPTSAGDYFSISAYTGDPTGSSRTILAGSSGLGVIGKSSHSGVLVYRTSDVSLGAFSTEREVTWDGEVYDTDGAWAVSPNPSRLVVPSGFTGARLSFTAVATEDTSVVNFATRIKKNGSDLSPQCRMLFHGQNTGTFALNHLQSHTPRLTVTPGDYFTAHVEGDAAMTSVLTGSWFEMELFA